MDSLTKNESSASFPSDLNTVQKASYTPIGIIHSPFKELISIPHQPEMGNGIESTIEVFPEYSEGLVHLERFIYITLVYHLHLSHRYKLKIKRAGEGKLRGIFSTRSPHCPNPIDISVVGLIRIEGSRIFIRDLDILDGTPALDIKPYKKGRME